MVAPPSPDASWARSSSQVPLFIVTHIHTYKNIRENINYVFARLLRIAFSTIIARDFGTRIIRGSAIATSCDLLDDDFLRGTNYKGENLNKLSMYLLPLNWNAR